MDSNMALLEGTLKTLDWKAWDQIAGVENEGMCLRQSDISKYCIKLITITN